MRRPAEWLPRASEAAFVTKACALGPVREPAEQCLNDCHGSCLALRLVLDLAPRHEPSGEAWKPAASRYASTTRLRQSCCVIWRMFVDSSRQSRHSRIKNEPESCYRLHRFLESCGISSARQRFGEEDPRRLGQNAQLPRNVLERSGAGWQGASAAHGGERRQECGRDRYLNRLFGAVVLPGAAQNARTSHNFRN